VIASPNSVTAAILENHHDKPARHRLGGIDDRLHASVFQKALLRFITDMNQKSTVFQRSGLQVGKPTSNQVGISVLKLLENSRPKSA